MHTLKRVDYSKIFTAIILIMPVLSKYKYAKSNSFLLSEVVFIGVCLIIPLMILKRGKIFFNRTCVWLLLFSLYNVVRIFISIVQGDASYVSIIGKFMRLTIILVGVFFADEFFDMPFAVKLYKALATIFSFILIVQFFVFVGTEKEIYIMLFKNMYLNISSNINTFEQYLAYIGRVGYRACSVFTEPAHFIQYVIIPLIICLFGEDWFLKVDMKCASIITIASILSFSASGVIMITVVWLFWIYKNFAKRTFAYSVFGMLVLGIIMGIAYRTTDFFARFLVRMQSIGASGGTTGTQRVLRGISVWMKEDSFSKVFGVGLGNISNYLIENRVRTIYDTGLNLGHDYMNMFSYILVSAGIIGLVLFLIYICSLDYKRNSKRVLLIVFVLLGVSAAIYLNATFMIFLIFLAEEEVTLNECSE